MMTKLATVEKKHAIARPLKVLVPLIQSEIAAGNEAGLEHYRKAGDMLLEAREQVPHGSWSRWIKANFELSQETARRYMHLARLAERHPAKFHGAVHIETALDEQPRRERHAPWNKIRDVADRVDVARLAEERQSRDDEIKMHRELAMQLIDLGYRALATRLHPDRGGSRDAMARLNVVRDELKVIAETRRFV
jgi:hypothetical protein